jgi:hypothetical protein
MSKSDTWENELLLLMFNNTSSSLHGDATGLRNSTTAGQYFVSLHTADPGDAGTQATNEIAYTSYARVGVNRASGAGGFTVSTNSASFASAVTFPAGTGGSGTATHWGLGCSSSGTGKLLYKGAISPTIVCGTGVTPSINAGTVVTED